MLEGADYYSIKRLNDTLIQGKSYFHVFIGLEGKTSMPRFSTRLENSEGSISETLYATEKRLTTR